MAKLIKGATPEITLVTLNEKLDRVLALLETPAPKIVPNGNGKFPRGTVVTLTEKHKVRKTGVTWPAGTTGKVFWADDRGWGLTVGINVDQKDGTEAVVFVPAEKVKIKK